jgi:DNA mismatch endonuclease (patch repair protein)
MSKIGPKNTKPELAVRSVIRSFGYRPRLHSKELSGRPDIVLSKSQIVIFVHGCFWHQHGGCRKATIPRQNAGFWKKKLAGNRERDRRVENHLRSSGWRVLVIWECETKNEEALRRLLDVKLKPIIETGL